jgi:hypothetical protein
VPDPSGPIAGRSIFEFPFNVGGNEAVDQRLLPDGALKEALDVVLRRDGQLEVRPGYTALPLTTFSANPLEAYDLVSYSDRLLCLGDQTDRGYPTDLFEWLEERGLWRGTGSTDTDGVRLPPATAVRDLGRIPEQTEETDSVLTATLNGYVAAAHNLQGGTTSRAHVFDPRTGQTLVLASLELTQLSVVAAGDSFWFIGITPGNAVDGRRYDITTDETLRTAWTLMSAGDPISMLRTAQVSGLNDFIVAAYRGSGPSVRIRRFNEDGSGNEDFTDSSIDASSGMAIEANTSRTNLVLIPTNAPSGIVLSTYTAAGALLEGPTDLFTPGTSKNMVATVCRIGGTQIGVAATINTTGVSNESEVRYADLTDETDHGTFTTTILGSSILTTNAVAVSASGDVVLGYVDSNRLSVPTNQLALINLRLPLVQKDHALSGFPTDQGSGGATARRLDGISYDSSRGRLYWGNLGLNSFERSSGVVTEVVYGSTDRRQCGQLGENLYLSGGIPLVYDGVFLFESGFAEVSEIWTATSSDGAGTLTSGAVYFFSIVLEAVDSQGNLHLSAPSPPFRVTMGAAHDLVTITFSTPHSLRTHPDLASRAGITVRAVLYRTASTATQTAASLVGFETAAPPSASLAGLTLIVTVDGGSPQTVTFAGSDDTLTEVIAAINSQVSGLTAEALGQFVKLVSDTEGTTSVLLIGAGTANNILGYYNGETSTGTRTVTNGEVLHREKSMTIPITGEYAAQATITSTMSDENLREQGPIYTEQQTPLPHYAPVPFQYVWPGRERLAIAGLPRATTWTQSKLLFPGEPVEFAYEGTLGFTGRISEEINGAVMEDEALSLFTRRGVYQVTGTGPAHNGQGEFFAAERIPSEGGLVSWKSLVTTTKGTFFQLDIDKIYLLTGKQLTWIGQPVRNTLLSYPVISAACHIRKQQQVAFSCLSTDGRSGVILKYDLRADQWFTERVGPVQSLCEYDGRLAYISDGEVFLEDAESGTGTFVPYQVTTGTFKSFQLFGYGQVTRVGFKGEYQGPCTVTASISYNDGQSFSELGGANGQFALSGLTVGDTVLKFWTPSIQMTNTWQVRFAVTHAGTGSKGVRLISACVETDKAPGSARRGSLDTH